MENERNISFITYYTQQNYLHIWNHRGSVHITRVHIICDSSITYDFSFKQHECLDKWIQSVGFQLIEHYLKFRYNKWSSDKRYYIIERYLIYNLAWIKLRYNICTYMRRNEINEFANIIFRILIPKDLLSSLIEKNLF